MGSTIHSTTPKPTAYCNRHQWRRSASRPLVIGSTGRHPLCDPPGRACPTSTPSGGALAGSPKACLARRQAADRCTDAPRRGSATPAAKRTDDSGPSGACHEVVNPNHAPRMSPARSAPQAVAASAVHDRWDVLRSVMAAMSRTATPLPTNHRRPMVEVWPESAAMSGCTNPVTTVSDLVMRTVPRAQVFPPALVITSDASARTARTHVPDCRADQGSGPCPDDLLRRKAVDEHHARDERSTARNGEQEWSRRPMHAASAPEAPQRHGEGREHQWPEDSVRPEKAQPRSGERADDQRRACAAERREGRAKRTCPVRETRGAAHRRLVAGAGAADGVATRADAPQSPQRETAPLNARNPSEASDLCMRAPTLR